MKRKVKIISLALAAVILFYIVVPLDLSRFDDTSKVVLDRNNQILRVFLNSDQQWCMPVDGETKVPEKLEQAVITYEDRSFYYHFGINPWAIARAIYLNIKFQDIKSGGSTITMQLARIAKPKSRTVAHKIVEMLQAIKLEIKLSKQDILQKYLNFAPYGGNIIGYQTASYKYFQKKPINLTWSEAATLAVLPNAPSLISPGKHSSELIRKRDSLLEKLHQKGKIDAATLRLSKLEQIPTVVSPLPQLAPHLSRKIIQLTSENPIKSTIDLDVQQRCEEILYRRAKLLQSAGIANVSVVVADTKSGEIIAYCGSQDFWDTENNGQVDGILAPRSPGSTLKPLLYALSIDEGIILPQTKINDVPSYYGAYAPQNANLDYDGLVTSKSALVRSLNIPAVRLLYTYGLSQFYHQLKTIGISTLFRRPSDYGLTLVLGGAEIKLLELAAAYRALGNEGKYAPLTFLQAQNKEREFFFVSAGSAYLTLQMLQEVKRPGSEYYWKQFENQWPLAWKTGTSFGNRDAWAMGVNPQWTIGVWVGNFGGNGNPAIQGAATAGPILFSIFESLPKDDKSVWFDIPTDLVPVQLCSESGYLVGESCQDTIVAWRPESAKLLQVCPYHTSKFIDKTRKKYVCSQCWEEGRYEQVDVLEYLPIVAKYLKRRGQFVPNILPHNPSCVHSGFTNKISIIYPTNESKIYLPLDFGNEKQKLSVKLANNYEFSTLFWYLDDSFVTSSKAKENIAFDVAKGTHRLYVIDTFGNESEVVFTIISE